MFASVRKLFLLPAAILVACSSGPGAPSNGPLGDAFLHASDVSGVPRDLLVAIAQAEGGLDMPAHRDVAPEVELPAAGPLMLRRGKLDTLARASALSGKTEYELRQDSDLALEAGARVLAELGGGNDLESWSNAIAEMSGYADRAHRDHYVHRVFRILASGGTFEGRDGEKIVLPAHDIPPTLLVDLEDTIHIQAMSEFPGAEWIPTSCSNKCDTSRGGASVTSIVIHDTEGGWDASVATLQNDSGKSVHYIVGTDGRTAQFIPESYTGWHAGNYYYNQRTVGIEHVGYSTKPYTEAEYAASAKLVDYLATKYKVPRDRSHIIGHDQIPDGNVIASSSPPCSSSPKQCESSASYGGSNNHRDPGVWEWATYMVRFNGNAKCNDVWDLWNCGWDLKRAFRCANGKVEVQWCNGPQRCVVKPNGTDDFCDQPSTDPPPPPSGTVPMNPGAQNPPGQDPTGPTTNKPMGGGCAIGGESSASSASLALLGIAFVLGKRRRVRDRRG